MISVFDNPLSSGFFGDPEAQAPWQEDRQIAHFLVFEAALVKALRAVEHVGQAEANAALAAIATYQPDMAGLAAGMAEDGVPVPAFVRQLRAAAGAGGQAIHSGATSQDVMDTALALTLGEVAALALARLDRLTTALDDLVAAHGAAPLMGRTRMQAALPITVADRLNPMCAALRSHRDILNRAADGARSLQLGGPVGTRSAMGDASDKIAAQMAAALGLAAAPAWHTDRSRIVNFAHALTLISGSLGKFGQDIALMAQQGIDEITLAAGGGSSAMPHKTNPVSAELLVALARSNAAHMGALHGAMIHEQERSGSAWMLEWMVLPQICTASCRALLAAEALCGTITRMGRPGA